MGRHSKQADMIGLLYTGVKVQLRRPGYRFLSAICRAMPGLTLTCKSMLRRASEQSDRYQDSRLRHVTAGA